jgi:hypothetical protein
MSTTHLDDQSEVRRLGASRVLVVDDYRGAAIATATYLSLDGIDARVVGGCGDALEAIKNWPVRNGSLALVSAYRASFFARIDDRECVAAAKAVRSRIATSMSTERHGRSWTNVLIGLPPFIAKRRVSGLSGTIASMRRMVFRYWSFIAFSYCCRRVAVTLSG